MRLTQYHHTAWLHRSGFNVPGVNALAQTDDGSLWLGTQNGLWRFDGVRFTRWSPRSEEDLPTQLVSCLLPARGGGLWIGTSSGVSLLKAGTLINYRESATRGTVRGLFEDSSRGLWAARSGYEGGGLTLLSSHGISSYRVADKLPDAGVNAIFEDRFGNLWVGTRRGLCRWSSGKAELFLNNPGVEIYSILEDGQGRLLVTTNGSPSILRLTNGRFEPVFTSGYDSSLSARVAITDRDGNTWLGTFSQGLLRMHDGRVDQFTRTDGLSGTGVQAILEDREGTIWVGTSTGLDRFRDVKVARVTTTEGLLGDLVTVVCASRGGALGSAPPTEAWTASKAESCTGQILPLDLPERRCCRCTSM